jgi:p-aminobenzoyl-glutamate transporter AbgT
VAPKSKKPVKRSARSDYPQNRTWAGAWLTWIEWLGNLLPHPVTLFALLAADSELEVTVDLETQTDEEHRHRVAAHRGPAFR